MAIACGSSRLTSCFVWLAILQILFLVILYFTLKLNANISTGSSSGSSQNKGYPTEGHDIRLFQKLSTPSMHTDQDTVNKYLQHEEKRCSKLKTNMSDMCPCFPQALN